MQKSEEYQENNSFLNEIKKIKPSKIEELVNSDMANIKKIAEQGIDMYVGYGPYLKERKLRFENMGFKCRLELCPRGDKQDELIISWD